MKRLGLHILLISISMFFISCGSKHNGHYVNIPDVHLNNSIIYTDKTLESIRANNLGDKLVAYKSKKIYLSIKNMLDETGNGQGMLPKIFVKSAQIAANNFGERVTVIVNKNVLNAVLAQQSKYKTLFLVDGRITALNLNAEEISSGIDFGLDFGKGSGESDTDNRFRNTDKISKITLDITFERYGIIYTSRSRSIDIKNINRGYSNGLRVNNSGFGTNAYHTKKDDVHKAIKRLLNDSLHSMIEEVIKKEKLLPPERVAQYNSVPEPINRKSNFNVLNKYDKALLEQEEILSSLRGEIQ